MFLFKDSKNLDFEMPNFASKKFSGKINRLFLCGCPLTFCCFIMWFYVMKFLFAYFLDTIIQYHSIILLRLVLKWSKILLHIWYQSIMIILVLELLLSITTITWLCIKKLQPNIQVTLIENYQKKKKERLENKATEYERTTT